MRACVLTSVVVLLGCAGAQGEEFTGVITKVEDGNVTFRKTTKENPRGEELTLPVASDVKVFRGKPNLRTKMVDAGEELPDGIKHKQLKGRVSVTSWIITDEKGKEIKEIRVFLPPEKR